MSSDPPPTLPLPVLPDPHRHHPVHLPLIHGGATSSASPSTAPSSLAREYRKGNWTIQETLILITAKKLDDERRLKTPSTSTSTAQEGGARGVACAARTSGELRWKWVENYCWSQGCLRSQNQCNDKWDNLLRDYKKVRDYEMKSEGSPIDYPSYWAMDKHQRKERNLPSNMVSEVYQAISEVLQRKYTQRTTTPQPQAAFPPPLPPLAPPPPPPPPPQAPTTSATPAVSERSESSATEYSEDTDSESKRRKVRNLGSSIMRSATVLARALQSCEEKKERRHRELMELEHRRLEIEETRNEVNRQGIASLVAAVTNLSGAIQSLISERHGHR
ncbi:hypothetical protein L6164_026407 [Bauhinia variegata]|uniref:Uncharacterized protein n=1 Tax=Bauhinia variegata TaxID=167791 RepID=A0ACB9LQA5_BAUVA|nr:hypothetical protein L6164_026407 [Bauhinia variegata]